MSNVIDIVLLYFKSHLNSIAFRNLCWHLNTLKLQKEYIGKKEDYKSLNEHKEYMKWLISDALELIFILRRIFHGVLLTAN